MNIKFLSDKETAEHLIKCSLLAGVIIEHDLLETLRTYHAHEIERDPQKFLKEYPHLYYVLTADDQKEFPSEKGLQLPQQLPSAEELKELFDYNQYYQIFLCKHNLPEYYSKDLLHSLSTAYNLLK